MFLKQTRLNPPRAVRAAGLPDTDPVRLRLALAQMPARLRAARRQFRKRTDLTAVMSLRGAIRDSGDLEPLSPPVHPRCAERLRTVSDAPCDEQWQHHIRTSQSSERTHTHVCPLGLRCSCVPIYLGGTFVGVAKVVADAGTPASDFSEATATLALTVSLVCHESYVAVLRDELQAMRLRARRSRRVEQGELVRSADARARARAGEDPLAAPNATIVARALDYLQGHYQEPDLSLKAVAGSLGCNARYLTHLFTQVVGQRMHGYLVGLRVERVCRELLHTDRPVKQIAFTTGFGGAGQLVRAFHRHVGVTPGAYRRIFGGG